ncbi:hypothetical protein T459_20596 [Capsicum annuum]|uniref:Uncharacterized protein n=1 Tax=Capsicum annuum TaxID=4072 RepID=A0A2G2Z540_CAPAN|nr:hypothetical protein T459_20596 [Capsicum annuum]
MTCSIAIPRTKETPRVGPNLKFKSGPGFLDRYNNVSSRFDDCGSRPVVSQVGTQYAPFNGNNGQMYSQKYDYGHVSNGNIQGGFSTPSVIGLNHMGSSGLFLIWAMQITTFGPQVFQGPNHYGFDGPSLWHYEFHLQSY